MVTVTIIPFKAYGVNNTFTLYLHYANSSLSVLFGFINIILFMSNQIKQGHNIFQIQTTLLYKSKWVEMSESSLNNFVLHR